MTTKAYGFLEVKGLVVGIEAADAMLKSALVRLVAQRQTDPALITLVVAGDIGACTAAVAAGYAAAMRVGEVLSQKVIGRPDNDIQILFNEPQLGLKPTPRQQAITNKVKATKADVSRRNRKKKA